MLVINTWKIYKFRNTNHAPEEPNGSHDHEKYPDDLNNYKLKLKIYQFSYI